jgi:hypothetical protein
MRRVGRLVLRAGYYFRPHLFAVLAGVALMFSVRWLSSMGGSCRFFCFPPVTFTLGALGGFLGAQLYRSENPLPPLREDARA